MKIVSVARDLAGDERRQKVVTYLKGRCEVVEVAAQLPRVQRLLNLARTVSVSKEVWRERSKKNSYYFRQSSGAVRNDILRATQGQFDVVLLFEALFSPGLGAEMLKPYVIYEDSTSRMALAQWPRWVPDRAQTAAYCDLEQQHYQGAARILTTNEVARRSLILDYGIPEERIFNVGQGHDFQNVEADARRPEENSILFVGYEFERKGGWLLLEAFREIRKKLSHAKLVIVGAKICLNEPGVTVVGRVRDKKELEGYYRRASVFVLPSIFDPMPHAVLEAMSFGVPVIVSSGCGTVELIQEGVNGFVVPSDEGKELTTKLLMLLQDRQLQRALGQAGAETVRSKCNWPDIAEKIAASLEAVVRPEFSQPCLR